MNELEKYFAQSNPQKRKEILIDLIKKKHLLAPEIAADLMQLPLNLDEKLSIIEAVGSADNLELECFLINGAITWEQNTASFALRRWAESTKKRLWFRVIAMAKSPMVPQRFRYTILDLAFFCGGPKILSALIQSPGLEELSDAFHSLLIKRCLEMNVTDPKVTQIARTHLRGAELDDFSQNKSLVHASMWMVKYEPKVMTRALILPGFSDTWRDLARLFLKAEALSEKSLKSLLKIVASDSKKSYWQKVLQDWPPIWLRPQIDKENTFLLLQYACQHHDSYPIPDIWSLFCGFDNRHVEEYFFQNKENAAILKPLISPILLADHLESTDSGMANKIAAAEKLAIEKDFPVSLSLIPYESNKPIGDLDDTARKQFFDVAYRRAAPKLPEKDKNNYWSLLTHNWQKPDKADLDQLASLSRRSAYLWHLPYIHTLGRFAGCDEAALKLMDFTRSDDPLIVRAVIESFAGIGTPRALQELLLAITRPNVDANLALVICKLLKDLDLSSLERELRSSLSDIIVRAKANSALNDVKETLLELVSHLDQKNAEQKASTIKLEDLDSVQIDLALSAKIPIFDQMTTEIKRALRTAYFFDSKLQNVDTHAIDLSPVLDMQYKALELLFRESFEEVCHTIISNGTLQRKLDVLGYARPIPQAMDQFENYIASLDVIRDIPFFSKFKLRKMLRGICLFRPGKRFTLDGLKAFALFFLCFGREKCTYNLNHIVKTPFASDAELFQFCKNLHVFQDFRNRAAHEGFRPEARGDIKGIWNLTAQIIDDSYKIRAFIKKS